MLSDFSRNTRAGWPRRVRWASTSLWNLSRLTAIELCLSVLPLCRVSLIRVVWRRRPFCRRCWRMRGRSREVEVVNLGITSIASFAVAQVVEDALVLSPDLVVVYTGHNEFYGLYGAGRHQRLQYFLRQLRLTHLVDGLLGGIGAKDEPTDLIKMAAARGEVPLHGSGRATAEQNFARQLAARGSGLRASTGAVGAVYYRGE